VLGAPKDPARPEKAIAWFRAKTPVTDAAYAKLTEAAKKQAFKVAGIAQLDLVTDVMDSLTKALEDGLDLDSWKSSIGEQVLSAWSGSVANPGWRLETIFRTNIQSAYAAGRYEEATQPETLKRRPYWRFDAVMDSRTSPICKPLDGTVRPADDPWWAEHHPPLHHACRSHVITLTDAQARRMGITATPPNTEAAPGFGSPPSRGPTWQPSPSGYPPDLWDEFRRKVAAE